MKKQKIQMLVLLGVLLLLCGALLGVKKYNQKQAEKPEETDEVVVIDVSTDDIIRFSYDYEGETYSYEKEDDTWYYAPDHSLKLLQYRTGNLMSGVAPLKTEQVIENVTDLEQYGLKEPKQTITYETTTESYILYVGSQNSVTGGYYVCMPSQSTVYMVDASAINKLTVTAEDLIDTTEDTTEESAESTEAGDTAEENTDTDIKATESGAATESTEAESVVTDSTETEADNAAGTESASSEK